MAVAGPQSSPTAVAPLGAFLTLLFAAGAIAFVVFVFKACSSALSGGSNGSTVADRSPEGNRTAKEIAYISLNQERIKAKLKDPQAATFQNSRVYYALAPVVCGEVNAANSFGGKMGFQRFVSGGSIQVLEEEMAPGEMDKTWAQVCR